MSTPAADPDATARVAPDAEFAHASRGGEAQFAPGTIIAGRYRIAGMLGAGGMGEVYRADDIKLGQPVALKFLPARLARDPLLLGRLHDEVRHGRQIAHPNVCRIYDIVDWDHAHFVAMEYVDGEDLARLLRRIGRVAHDKAVDIARGIAAGLHAAHTKGILHRDLKPANVMIDSHGEARIMDFGLAHGSADAFDGIIAGTPAYMAPEQLAGEAATVQSDLYALGLVMYELFTGKRAHSGKTLPDRIRDSQTQITTPSDVIRDIDPAVERIIIRCVANDPAQRPRSAREVIEALPGGDPLAAALAAGETPSPRVVAAAGTEGSLRPPIAWTLFGACVLLIALQFAIVAYTRPLIRTRIIDPPEVYAARTKDLLARLGIPRGRFTSGGFEEKDDYLAWIIATGARYDRVERGLPAVTYWLREEPAPLLDQGLQRTPKPAREAPPQTASGSVAIEINPRDGTLASLSAIAADTWKPRRIDWDGLLAAAGLQNAKLTPVEPRVVPRSAADERRAWRGTHPADGTPIRVEAAAWRGVPVLFRIIAPWNERDRLAEVAFAGGGFFTFGMTAMGIAIIAAALLAWRNLRARRGDRNGAFRVAATIFTLTFIATLAFADHELVLLHEVSILIMGLEQALTSAAAMWIAYIALEPYVRRRWPEQLISWARLIAGDVRNPMIGRDVLIGMVAGLLHIAIAKASAFLFSPTDTIPPLGGATSLLDTAIEPFAQLATSLRNGILQGITVMVVLMLLTIVLRRRDFAVAGIAVLFMVMYLFASTQPALVAIFAVLVAIQTFVVVRIGLLAQCVSMASFGAMFVHPFPDAIAWYTMRGTIVPLLWVAVAIWAFRTALGGQNAFGALDV